MSEKKLFMLKQEGVAVYVNPNNVNIVSGTNLVNKSALIFSNGTNAVVDGTPHEVADIVNGSGGPLLESRLIQ